MKTDMRSYLLGIMTGVLLCAIVSSMAGWR